MASHQHAHPAADAHEHDAPHAGDHGHAGNHGHHGHKIVSVFTLRFILAVLLFFTALTVGLAKAEVWAMHYFDIALPAWVNIVGVVIIATIKGLLVMGYFMQLRFDNPINTVIMAFTFFAFAIFMGFSLLDMSARDRLYAYKAPEITAGGTGVAITRGQEAISGPIVLHERNKRIASLGEEGFAAAEAAAHAKSHGKHEGHGPKASSGDRSRARAGATPGLFELSPTRGLGYGSDHGHEHGHEKSHGPEAPADPAKKPDPAAPSGH
jgi:caa(3)-type oxidase subunit IV